MTEGRYRAHGPQAEFEPGSGGRVLRNRLGIKRVRQIEQAESEALLALQAGRPALDFTPLAGRGKAAYIAAVQQAVGGDYTPMEECFRRVIRRTLRLYRGRE